MLSCARDSCVLGWSMYLLLSPLMSLQSLFASVRKLIVSSVFLPFESLLCFNFRIDVGVQLLYACESVLCGCK